VSVDLAEPIRDALVASSEITALLATYAGDPAVFTRRPVPGEAGYPFIVVTPDVTVTDQDGIFDFRPLIVREVIAYSRNDTSENYRKADQLAYLVHALFHRQRRAITVPGWDVVDIVVTGPSPTSQDDQTEGRSLLLTVSLAKIRS
jgi:hypothetical protein